MLQPRLVRSSTTIPGLLSIEEMVHAGLVQSDNDGVLRPRLAEAVPSVEQGSWAVFPDGRMQTTWRLRPEARWHDGTPVTSADLLFTIAVEHDKDLAIPLPVGHELIEGVEAPSSDTIVVTWKQPFIEADAFFSGEMSMPMPKHLLERTFVEDKANFAAAPYWTQEFVGAGPFVMREWAMDSHVVVAANDAYFLGRPKVDEVEIRFIVDQGTLIANLMAGTVELTLGRTLIPVDQALQVTERRGDVRNVYSYRSWFAIHAQFVNPSPAIITDLRFRRAVLHALDRQQLADTFIGSAFGGLSSIAHTWVGPDTPEYQEIQGSIVRYEYDVRRAGQMIEVLGYSRGAEGLFFDAGGQKLSVQMVTTARSEIQPKILSAIADNLKQAGVEIEQVHVPAQRMQDREFRATWPGFEMLAGSNGLALRDVQRFHSSSTPLPENRFLVTGNNSRYKHPELDAAIDRYVTTIPRRERIVALGDIVRHQTENLPTLGLFYDAEATVVTNRLDHVTGRGPTSTQAWNAAEWLVK